jgi:hypothetical protein
VTTTTATITVTTTTVITVYNRSNKNIHFQH